MPGLLGLLGLWPFGAGGTGFFKNLGFEKPDASAQPGLASNWTTTISANAEAYYDFSAGNGDSLSRETFDIVGVPFRVIVFGGVFNAMETASVNWTVNVATSTFKAVKHRMPAGLAVDFAAPPGGVTAGTDYYLVNITDDTFQLATSPGGSPVTLSGVITSGVLTYLHHPLQNGMAVELEAPGLVEAPVNTTFYVRDVTQSTWNLAATQGGTPISAGSTTGVISFRLVLRVALIRLLQYTVDQSTSVFTLLNHGLVNDNAVRTVGNPPAGLGAAGETLYVVNATESTFQLSATLAGGPLTVTGVPLSGLLLRVDAADVIFNAGGSSPSLVEDFENGTQETKVNGVTKTGPAAAYLWALAQQAAVHFATGAAWTVNVSTSTFTAASGRVQDGLAVRFAAPPGGLVAATNYYAVNATLTTFQLAATPGGSPITITGGPTSGVLTCFTVIEDFEGGWSSNESFIFVLVGNEAAAIFATTRVVEDFENGWGNDAYLNALGGSVTGFTVGTPPSMSTDTDSFEYTFGIFSFSVDGSTNLFTVATTILDPAGGQAVQFAGPGIPQASPAIVGGARYFTRDVTVGVSSTTFRVSATSGGSAITLSTNAVAGTGATIFGDPAEYWNELVT